MPKSTSTWCFGRSASPHLLSFILSLQVAQTLRSRSAQHAELLLEVSEATRQFHLRNWIEEVAHWTMVRWGRYANVQMLNAKLVDEELEACAVAAFLCHALEENLWKNSYIGNEL